VVSVFKVTGQIPPMKFSVYILQHSTHYILRTDRRTDRELH